MSILWVLWWVYNGYMDLRQSKGYGAYMKRTGWIVERIGDISAFIKKLPFLPVCVMKIQRFERSVDMESIKRLRRKYRVIYIVLEPMKRVDLPGFRLSSNAYLPTKTLIVDLK